MPKTLTVLLRIYDPSPRLLFLSMLIAFLSLSASLFPCLSLSLSAPLSNLPQSACLRLSVIVVSRCICLCLFIYAFMSLYVYVVYNITQCNCDFKMTLVQSPEAFYLYLGLDTG